MYKQQRKLHECSILYFIQGWETFESLQHNFWAIYIQSINYYYWSVAINELC